MNWSKLRVLFSIFIMLIAGLVVVYQLRENTWSDSSAEAQLRGLESSWTSKRREAAAGLAQFPGEADRVIPALVKALSDSDTEVRLNALESLKTFGEKPKAAGPILKEMLRDDPNNNFRGREACVLGLTRDRDAVPDLIEALDAQDPGVRIEATRALGQFGPSIATTELIDQLVDALKPEQPEELREASVIALESIAPDQERVARALAEVLAKDPSPMVRNKALTLMSKSTFGFEVPTLIAALEDSSPQVRLAAGEILARIGLNDDRTVPALCKAARKADESTREGIGMSFEHLQLDSSQGSQPDDRLAQRYQAAVREMGALLETKQAAGREQVLTVLSRLIASYQKSDKTILLEPARAAVAAVLARMDDETEDVPLRVPAMNQWGMVQPLTGNPSWGASSSRAAADSKDKLHSRASWIAALGRALKSSVAAIRSRAVEILTDSFAHPRPDPSFTMAWRKVVPTLVEAARSEDPKVRSGALSLLGMLGPEAREGLESLRSLTRATQDVAVQSAAEAAIKSIACVENLKAKDPATRTAAAETLGGLDWRATPGVPALIEALKDPDPNGIKTAITLSGITP